MKPTTDERADRTQGCCGCGCDYDERGGGQEFGNVANDEVIALCEECQEAAIDATGILEDSDTLTGVEFATMKKWAGRSLVLSFVDRLDDICSVETVKGFFDALSGFLNWHPDTGFEGYETDEGVRVFDEEDSAALNRAMVQCFAVVASEPMGCKDVYALAFESAQGAGWAPADEVRVDDAHERRAERERKAAELLGCSVTDLVAILEVARIATDIEYQADIGDEMDCSCSEMERLHVFLTKTMKGGAL